MSSALGIIGIILAVAFLIYFAYKGINVILLGVISCLIIMVFNGMPVIKSVNKVMLPGVCTYITAMAGPTLMGYLIAAFYETSGAARSVADALYRLFTISARRRQRESGGSEPVMLSPLLSILIVYAIGVTLSYGGLNPVVILFILMPVASDVFEKSGIPRSMLPGIVLGALATASCSMPGTTSDQNIIASQFLHTSAMAAPIPGFIGGAFVLALNITVMNHLAKKEIARGHLYTPQQRELKMTDDSRKPHWLISIIPMTSTIIGYNAFKWNILAALALNVVLCLVLFWRYLGGLNGFVKLLEPVPMQFAQLVLQVGILGSIGAVASASPAGKNSFEPLRNREISSFLQQKFSKCLLSLYTHLPQSYISTEDPPPSRSKSFTLHSAMAFTTGISVLPHSVRLYSVLEVLQDRLSAIWLHLFPVPGAACSASVLLRLQSFSSSHAAVPNKP